ncbi:MAG: YlmC/YmxH family sporulation protein [Hyphomonadaceae bacterium]|nr:YlmC/YmxH family sporulation protein [Clostridia bacterium]
MSRISEFRQKEVINILDGKRYGYVIDVELDLEKGNITAVIVPGRTKFFGIFGKQQDYIIPWQNIHRIGEDIILVEFAVEIQTLSNAK